MTPNTRRTIIERNQGWEKASPALLARVFDTSPQAITAILRDRCKACGQAICGHSDLEYAGISTPPGEPESDRAGGLRNGQPARKRQRGRGVAVVSNDAAKVGNGAPHSGLVA